MARRLTGKQQRFVEEYLIDLNATQAAIRAGYPSPNADKIGSELLGKTRVTEAIEQAQAERAVRVQITQDRVVYELALVGTSDIDHYVIDDEGNVQLAEGAPRHAKRAISSIKKKVTNKTKGEYEETVCEVEIRFWSKTDALHTLAKHLGMLVARVEHAGKGGGPIETQNADGLTEVERFERLLALAQRIQESRI